MATETPLTGVGFGKKIRSRFVGELIETLFQDFFHRLVFRGIEG
ncbi:MAG: hypothetical protein WA974_16870 [Thermodesulfobacteriota bacterium]